MSDLQLPILLCAVLLQLGMAANCPQLTSYSHIDRKPLNLSHVDSDTRQPLYLLTLVPIPSGIDVLPGALTAQAEVNNASHLLPGYRVELVVDDVEECSSTVAGRGLTSLVRNTLTPSCCPVVAVMGLECSSHTAILSPVAGRDGFNLIQLAAANSPVFRTNSNRFPHLWHLLGSATAYTSTVLAIMEQYSLKRIGLVYSLESEFHSQNAQYLRTNLTAAGKSVQFSVGILGTTQLYYYNTVFSEIKHHQTTIIVSMLDELETATMLPRAHKKGLIHPNYLWIHFDLLPEHFTGLQNNRTMQQAVNGHIFLHTLTQLAPDKTLVSGETYHTYSQRLMENLDIVRNRYNISGITTRVLANHVYDQVWAIALALNQSIPVLNSMNLSIDNYSIGQSEVTAIIEQQLANVSFQGAGGWVEFNQNNAVSTPVEVFWVTSNGTWSRVGLYDPMHSNLTDFRINVSDSDIPDDTPSSVIIIISTPIASLLYSLAGALLVFTTILLILYLRFRHHKVIKASSPKLSLLMFAGCYILNFAVIVKITFGSFKMNEAAFLTLAILHVILLFNGMSLVFITLFVKLVRLYHIFSSLMKKDLGKYWYDFSLFLFIIFSLLIPNIVIAVTLALKPPVPIYYDVMVDNMSTIETHIKIESTSQYILIGILTLYVIVLLCLVLYFGVHNRKIKNKALNDTRQVLLFLTIMIMAVFLVTPLYLTYLISMNEPVANIILVVGFMVLIVICQLILFLPKIVHAMFNKNNQFVTVTQTSIPNRLAVGLVATIVNMRTSDD